VAGQNSKEVLDIKLRPSLMQVLNLARPEEGEHKSQELQVNDGSPERMAYHRGMSKEEH
jgi:hypothetical protein